jgi:hypothetical protein
MADDTLEHQAGPDTGKAKRAPPTIDLGASEVSDTTWPAAEAKAKSEAKPEPNSEARSETKPEAATAAVSPATAQSISRPISPWVIAPLSGAVAAALVIVVGWMLGWPAVQAPPPAPQVDASVVDGLGKRVAAAEAKLDKLAAPLAQGALQKPIKDLGDDVANLRAQVDKLAAAEVKSAQQGPATATVDLSTINDRIAKVEDAVRASSPRDERTTTSKAPDDLPLRRLVAAALLDVAVRHGDPFAALLATAKTLALNPDELKPLDQFTEKGVPNSPALNRELLTLVPRLSPAQDAAATGNSIVEKLQAGAAKLVRIERSDATGNDRSAIVARVTAAAIRNDFADARRELASLSAEDRAPAQAWLDRAAARDAALEASRHFADETMAALAKPAQ